MRVAILAYAVSIPFAVAGPLMPEAWMSVVCTAVGGALALMAAPPMIAAMQSVTPSGVRAQINSLYLLLFSGITGIIGPALIGWLTDLQHDETKLRMVIVVTSAVGLPVSTAILALAARPYGRIITRIKAEEAAAGV